jgi:hypothetical protein
VRFRDVLASAPPCGPRLSPEALLRTVSATLDPLPLLAGTAWGSIRWSRSLGLPIGPRATSFSVMLWGLIPLYQTSEGVVEGWMKLDQPSVWDGPDDDDHHRVSFVTYGFFAGVDAPAVEAVLRPVPWTLGPYVHGGRPRLEPAFLPIDADAEHVTVLPEQVVFQGPSPSIH